MLTRRVLSGIQPTGIPTLGNYLGAIRAWVADTRGAEQSPPGRRSRLFCVVDEHALTIPRPAAHLAASVRGTAAALLASGLDPRACTVFLQSEVPQHAELAWMLGCSVPEGWLRGMTQWKEKSRAQGGGSAASLGLLSYPVLMAADILLYRVTHVPVGEDQTQHLELARRICERFNTQVGQEILVLPEAQITGKGDIINPAIARVRSLRDPLAKMSKSDPIADARILLDDTPDVIRRKVSRSVTDARRDMTYDPEDRPGVANLLGILAALRSEIAAREGEPGTEFTPAAMADELNRDHGGAPGSGVLKASVTDALVQVLGPISAEIERHMQDGAHLDSVLDEGRDTAIEIAGDTLKDVRHALGLGRSRRSMI